MENEQNNLKKQPQEEQKVNNNTNIEQSDNSVYNRKGQRGFLPGNPGRPVGLKSKWTVFKERLLAESGGRNLAEVKTDDLLRIIANLAPKEKEQDINQQVNITKVVWELDGKETEAPQKSRNRIHESEQV
jgi:hypothetical protein